MADKPVTEVVHVDAALDALVSPTSSDVYEAVDAYSEKAVGAVAAKRALGAGGGSQPPGALSSAEFLFTEEATEGTYTATLPVLAGTLVEDIRLFNLSDTPNYWAADTALLNIFDGLDSYYTDQDLTAGAYGLDNLYDPDSSSDFTTSRSLRWHTVASDITAPWRGNLAQSMTMLVHDTVRNAAGSGATPAWVPNSSNTGVGRRYATDDTITLQVVTTIGSPPVSPVGQLLVKVIYFAPVTAVAAAFA